MKTSATITAMIFILCSTPLLQTHAQGPGNIDWQEIWVNYPPPSPDPANQNYWMFGNRTYTSLAYDENNDVVYIVNPGTCTVGSLQFKCQRIHAWDAETGAVAIRIEHSQGLAPQGQVYVNQNIVDSSFSRGQYSIFRIDLDDEGRIYAANVVAPVFGVCYPGPPPQCDDDYLSQGPYKVYRWNSPSSGPELIYRSVGTGPNNTQMLWAMWGTAFDVVGQTHEVAGQTVDSTRIFTSGGKFYTGTVAVNDQVNVLLADTRQDAPTPFRLGIRMIDAQAQSGLAAHGIAATGPYPISQIYTSAGFRQVVLNNQNQTNDAMPQDFALSLNQALTTDVTGFAGPIRYFIDERYNRPYLICANTKPDSVSHRTTVRVVDLASGAPYQNWPPSATPQFGTTLYNNLTGIDNWITDVDYKIWVDPVSGKPYLQVFVLMSNNGIACYRSREPLPDIPVEMETFRGMVDGNNVSLNWQTASETNNKGFEVYRSFNHGSDWEKIGFVDGIGTTTMASEYSFPDPITGIHTSIGTVQYRLKQVDFDGSHEWTDAIDVYISSAPGSIILGQNYPNPASGGVKISYQLPEDDYATLRVYNSLGTLIATLDRGNREAGMHFTSFDTRSLPPGTYVYRLETATKSLQKKMIVTH